SQPGANVGICLRDNAETLVMMVALWMSGATAVPMDFRTNAAEKSLLAKEFDLVAILEDKQVNAAGYTSEMPQDQCECQSGTHGHEPGECKKCHDSGGRSDVDYCHGKAAVRGNNF